MAKISINQQELYFCQNMFSRGNVKRGGRKHVQGHFNFFLSQQVFLQVSLSCSLYWSGSALTPTHKQELDRPHNIMDNSISNGYLQWIFYHNRNYKQEVTLQQALICFQTLAAP